MATMATPYKITLRGKEKWVADMRSFGGGREYFNSQEDAVRAWNSAKIDQANFGKLAWKLSHKERTRYLSFESRLAELGTSMEELLAFWERTHRPAAQKDLAEAIQECVAAKVAAGKRKRSMQQLGYSLNSFAVLATELGIKLVSGVTLAHVERWLTNPSWSMRTRKNNLVSLRTFFSFAVKRSWAPADPSAPIEPIVLDEGPPGILTVPQVQRLLEATRKTEPDFLPFIVLGVFAGVRPDEIKQLSWSQVNLETGYCEIPAHIAKRVKGGGSRQRRLIKLQPNAIAWLKLKGDLPPVSWQDCWDRVRKAAGFAVSVKGKRGKRVHCKGEPWPKNAMRHSFCSYCLPVFGELKESEWAGHSPQVAISRYRELVTQEQAEAFWKITP